LRVNSAYGKPQLKTICHGIWRIRYVRLVMPEIELLMSKGEKLLVTSGVQVFSLPEYSMT
jgi:hypothetical protein